MKTNSVYPSQSILLLKKVNTFFQCDNNMHNQKKKIVSFILNCSITQLITLTALVDGFQANYYLTTQNISDQIPILFHCVLQNKIEFIKLSSFQNFPAGAGTRSALLKGFPTPRCRLPQHTDTVDFVRDVLENSGAEEAQGDVMYCRLSRKPIHWEQSRAPGSCYFVCRLQSKYCKAHSKARLRTQCCFRTATWYTTRSFPFFPFKIEGEGKKKIKKDISMTSGALKCKHSKFVMV